MVAEAVESGLTAKDAIAAGFALFRDFYSGEDIRNVLLEGLEFDQARNEWDVSIGFDLGRKKTKGSQLSFLEETQEPIREIRTIRIKGDDGAFVRMVSR